MEQLFIPRPVSYTHLIIKVIETLLREFTYKVVEEGRRRATLNMLEAAKAASMCKSDDEIDAEFRKRLLAYLSTDMKNAGKKSARLKDIINNATDIGLLNKIIRSSNNRVKKENLVGETDRLLEAVSYTHLDVYKRQIIHYSNLIYYKR